MAGRHRREIDMPDVIRSLCANGAGRLMAADEELLAVGVSAHPPNRCGAEVEPSAAEHLRDPFRPHSGAEGLEPANDVGNEIWKAVDGFGASNEGIRPLLVEAPRPGCDGQRSHEQVPRGLRERPSAGRPEFEDRESLRRRVVRPPLRRDSEHPSVFDSELLAEKGDLLPESVHVRLESHPLI